MRMGQANHMDETTKVPLSGPLILRQWKNLPIVALSVLIIALCLSGSMDKTGRKIVDEAFSQALIVFATARTLNAVISVVQGTEVGPPGVTIAVGEILDPVNDLVERFSWIMLVSVTSLGIQTILMDIVATPLFNYLLVILIAAYNLRRFVPIPAAQKPGAFFRLIVFVLFVRFSMPLMSIANTLAYEHFVQPHYDIAVLDEKVTTLSREIGRFKGNEISLFDTDSYYRQLERLKAKIDDAGNHVVKLVIVFVFRTIVFPLLFLLLFYKGLVKGIATGK